MEDLLIYLFKSAGLISIFFVAYMLLLKNDTSLQLNRLFLLAGPHSFYRRWNLQEQL